jgi:hypothetical protein
LSENLSVGALQSQLQSYLNCLELCRALHRRTKDRYLKGALEPLIEDLHDSLASLAGHMRRIGAAPGGRELDQEGAARIRDVLSMRNLYDQMLAVRHCLVDLVQWYEEYLPALEAGQPSFSWFVSLSEEARRIGEGWDREMHEMVSPK